MKNQELMNDEKKTDLLTEGGRFLKTTESLIRMSDDALELNETASLRILSEVSKGNDEVPQNLAVKARKMLLMIDFIRTLKST